MPQQSTLRYLVLPRPRSSVPADKAPNRAKSITSHDRANATVASQRESAPLTPPSSQFSPNPPSPRESLMDALSALPDSTDWIPTSLPTFEPLEAALRCEVCKEFYTNPVITSCSHTFCSICIRRCIATDGKCPACKTACQADKLLPNYAVREVATKFQEARPRALELARADKERDTPASGKKRKLVETDIEEGEPVRQTRSRQTRQSSRRGEATGAHDGPMVIPDSEDERDEEYLPDGMVKCPICSLPMKEEAVFNHLNNCPGEEATKVPNTRAKKNNAFPNALQARQKESTPPTTRLSGLNYAMLTESALRKKLKELGIPNWGAKSLLIRRHQEWLNLYNSNCDSSENFRKTKRQLLTELDEWERTQGGSANFKESHIMRKDFDGLGHATTHKTQFDDLIANARKRAKAAPKEEEGNKEEEPKEASSHAQEQNNDTGTPQRAEEQPSSDPSRAYEGNESALSSIRAKVEEANRSDSALPSLSPEIRRASATAAQEMQPSEDALGFQDPFKSPSRKVSMFQLPEEPVMDVESSTTVQ